MNVQEKLTQIKELHLAVLNFIDKEDDIEEHFTNLFKIIEEQKIRFNRSDLKVLLRLLSKISKNHHRENNFFIKIERILEQLQKEIQNFFKDSEIFKIFKRSKRLLLFFIQKSIITPDRSFFKEIKKKKYELGNYKYYFLPEILPFMAEDKYKKHNKENDKIDGLTQSEYIESIMKLLPKDFYEKRLKGENDNHLCEIIRNDSIDEFITYVKKEEYPLKSEVEPSIYETNTCLIDEKVSLIEYAAFFGSVQIFKYLLLNGVEYTQFLWTYSIYSNNPEVIYILENQAKNNEEEEEGNGEIEILPFPHLYFLLSIKCHHNDLANYIQNNYLDNTKKISVYWRSLGVEHDIDDNVSFHCFNYCNFSFFSENQQKNGVLYYACFYDYLELVKLFLSTHQIDLNKEKISFASINDILNYIFNKISN